MELKDANGIYTEERVIQGITVNTPDLHNVHSNNCGPNYEKPQGDDGTWCFQATYLSVNVPGDKWIFVGSPNLVLVRDNEGSAGWNELGKAGRYSILENNPTSIKAKILTGSHDIAVRLDCLARFYPS